MTPLLALPLLATAVGLYHRYKPLPPGLARTGPWREARAPRLLVDLTATDSAGTTFHSQEIFPALLAAIRAARRLVVLDVFLYNDFAGQLATAPLPPLADELTRCLVECKLQHPEMTVVVISDPMNTVYGSLDSPFFARLKAAGIPVVLTRLDRLRDSNPLYSCWWRLLARPLASGPGRLLANPFGAGRISLASFLRLLNFKANHRKVLIADRDGDLVGLVGSANPHDASADHTNVALSVAGPVAHDLLASEAAVLALSGVTLPELPPPAGPAGPSQAACQVRLVTESGIRAAALAAIAAAGPGDRIDLLMFYLSHRRLLRALKEAHRRGAELRLLLDPNRDAFGLPKDGLPNRQTAAELHRQGIAVRWAATHGEQCHAKLLLVSRGDGESRLLTGSANFTRRNLDDLNLETDLELRGPSDAPVFIDAAGIFETMWHNRHGRLCSVDFAAFADPSVGRRLLARLQEATGMGTF